MLYAFVRITSAIVLINISLSCLSVTAQSAVKLLDRQGDEVAKSVLSDARLKSLSKELHPGIYFRNGEMKVKDKAATTLYTDIASLENLGKKEFSSSDIEMVTIQLNTPSELTSKIDLTVFNSYPRLKYVRVLAAFPCTTDQLYSTLNNIGDQYRVLLSVEPVN